MTNEDGSLWVILNGEIYNYRALRDELIGKGHRFRSSCDTEVLVHLYEQEGPDCLHRLRGMFAFALWDRGRQRLLVARDPFGIKPLYYAERAGGLRFASELPALLAAMPRPSIDPAAIARYLTRLYVPSPGSIYAGVRELQPGECLTAGGGRVTVERYFTPATAWKRATSRGDDGAAAPGDLIERWRETLRDSVSAHLVSDVPLGLFLSGGLDSGAILAMMRSITNGPIKTFSIGYAAAEDRSYDELDAARLLATHFGTDHTEERLQPDAVALLPTIVAAMAEPFADASAIPTYLVSRFARRSVTVALSGIGGDELFGGYPRYLGIRAAAHYGLLPAPVRRAAAAAARHLPESTRSQDAIGRIKRLLRAGDRPLAEQYAAWVTFLPMEWGSAALTDPLAAAAEDSVTDDAARFAQWPAEDPADRAMGTDMQSYLPDDLLRMGDRLSMAHSLELRVPFCDLSLLSLAFQIPPSVRLAHGTLKSVMRRALAGLLPAPILGRPKTGFQVPLARWLRSDLREMTADLLAPAAVKRRGYVKPEYVAWVLSEHQDGRRNFADQIYALLVLEIWHRQQESQA